MKPDPVPEFAIVGHPNEGKSSVVSTLAEDDSVRISPTPGETIRCQTFPVTIDGTLVRKHACIDGPELDAHAIDWDKFLPRFTQFRSQEQRATAAADLV